MRQLELCRLALPLARLPGSLEGGANQILTRTGSNDSYAWTGHGSGSTASEADGLNRLSSIGGSAASYDARGNLATDPTSGKSFTYWPSDNALCDYGDSLLNAPNRNRRKFPVLQDMKSA